MDNAKLCLSSTLSISIARALSFLKVSWLSVCASWTIDYKIDYQNKPTIHGNPQPYVMPSESSHHLQSRHGESKHLHKLLREVAGTLTGHVPAQSISTIVLRRWASRPRFSIYIWFWKEAIRSNRIPLFLLSVGTFAGVAGNTYFMCPILPSSWVNSRAFSSSSLSG